MKINKLMTKMLVSKAGIKLKNKSIREVGELNYLRSKITSNGGISWRETVSKMNQAKTEFNKKKNLLTSEKINL